MKQKFEHMIALAIYSFMQIGLIRVLCAVAAVVVLLTVTAHVARQDTRREYEQAAIAAAAVDTYEADEPEAEPLDYVITPEGNILSSAVPMDERYQCTMQDACRKYDVPYPLALGIATQESHFDFEADSGLARGIMQISYDNLKGLDLFENNGIDPNTYDGNIEAGVCLIGHLLDQYTDANISLMYYNSTYDTAQKQLAAGVETTEYTVAVLASSERWARLLGVEESYFEDMDICGVVPIYDE